MANLSLPTRHTYKWIVSNHVNNSKLAIKNIIPVSANLNTYVISYLRHEVESSTDYADWIFISTSKTLVQGLVMPFAGLLSNRLGLRTSLAIGSILYSSGYLLTGLAINHSLPTVIVTMAVMHGLGFALVYSQTVGAVMAWSPTNPGTFGGICIAGYGFGSMIWNPLETGFVNPKNRLPVVGNGTDAWVIPEGVSEWWCLDYVLYLCFRYFEDPDVLARTPILFYLLGGTFIVMQIVAIILLRVPTEEELAEMVPILGVKDHKASDQENDKDETFSLRPLQVLKTAEFYKMWVSFLAMNMINMFINNYQKSFGQLFIEDDNFFAIIATLSSVANGVTRMIWGYTYDKLGFQVRWIPILVHSNPRLRSYTNFCSPVPVLHDDHLWCEHSTCLLVCRSVSVCLQFSWVSNILWSLDLRPLQHVPRHVRHICSIHEGHLWSSILRS